jgi:hypothetical protein
MFMEKLRKQIVGWDQRIAGPPVDSFDHGVPALALVTPYGNNSGNVFYTSETAWPAWRPKS